MENFNVNGPFGEIECIVEPNRSDRNAVLVMAHGFRGSRDSGGKAPGIAHAAACCCDVVRFNFTGTRKISDIVEELHSVIDRIKELKPDCAIYLLGRSLGGGASIITASQDKDISRLILWSTMNDLRYTFGFVMGEKDYKRVDSGESIRYEDERGEFIMTPEYLKDFDNYNLSELLTNWRESCPVLLFHCEGDETVLCWQAKKNAELLGNRGELYLFPNGDHSLGEHSDRAGEILAKWLRDK